jgi:hypothetical protein
MICEIPLKIALTPTILHVHSTKKCPENIIEVLILVISLSMSSSMVMILRLRSWLFRPVPVIVLSFVCINESSVGIGDLFEYVL